MNFKKIFFALILLSIVCTGFVYDLLPSNIPSQWGFNGEISDYKPRWFAIVTALLPMVMYMLMIVVPKIDPKKKAHQKHKKVYEIFTMCIVLFLIAIHWAVIGISVGFKINISMYIRIGLGILFIILGNRMGQIRPNYLLGIKTPWTLHSETVWKKTHKFGGIVFIVVGVIQMLAVFIRGSKGNYVSFISIALLLISITLYSYLAYAREQKNKI